MFSQAQLAYLSGLASEAARAAGQVIEAYRGVTVQAGHKSVGTSAASQVVTEVDHKAQAAILEILQPSCAEYGLALLTEESPDDGERQRRPAFWCIDPMDGTLAFCEGNPGFSVCIALVARDGIPLIGVVYDPLSRSLYRAVRGQGAYRDDRALSPPGIDPRLPLTLRTDFSFQQHPWLQATRQGLEDMARRLGMHGAAIEFRVGAVMNACGILETPNTCYFKYPRSGNSGGSLWDYAATACLYQESGAVASDIHGRPMQLNRPGSTFMNHRGLLYAGNRQLASQITALFTSLNRGSGNFRE